MSITAERLTQLRKEYGMSMTEFAKRLGVSRSTISRYEKGEMQPSLDAMISINKAFGVSLDWLAGLTDKKK